MKSNTLEFIIKAKDKHGDKYDYSDVKYIHSKTKVTIKCNKCGLVFLLTPNSHLKCSGCPKCKKSKGENLTEQILKSLLIPYYTLYYIGYKGNFMLVDFYIELNNSKYIIEYNGMQHYVPIKYFGGEVLFKRQLTRDNRLKKYCLENNIKLLEIKYNNSKEQIQELVTNFLNNND